MAAVLKADRRNSFPGDTAMILRAAAIDEHGTRHPAGTTFQPQSAGHDGAIGADYQIVIIGGSAIRFTAATRPEAPQ